MAESPARVRVHEVLARRWGVLAVLALAIAAASAWWAFGYLMSGTWERVVLSGTLVAVPLIGWATFLFVAAEHVEDWNLRKILAGLAVIVIVASLVAAVCLGGVRMMGAALDEEQRRTAQDETESDRSAEARLVHVEAVARHVRSLGVIALSLIALASEVAAGLAFHEWWKHHVVVRTVRWFEKKLRTIVSALVENAVGQEQVRRLGQMLHAQLTVEGLLREGKARSLLPVVRWVVIGIAVLLACLLAAAVAFADGASTTVILFDLSDSTDPGADFRPNVKGVESVLRAATPGERFVVLAIAEASFGKPPIFAAKAPTEPGRFSEVLLRWQRETVHAWRLTAERLSGTARASDIIGALNRAALEFRDRPDALHRLVIFSDMRHVRGRLNFERGLRDPAGTMAVVLRESPVPDLTNAEVTVYGVHTRGIDEAGWRRLKAFWTDYVMRAGAKLRRFTPNRDMTR